MINNNCCPKIDVCPIFGKNILHNERVGETYKNLYCLQNELGFNKCKRFQVSKMNPGKKIPENIMPNSSFSIEDIVDRICGADK